jgi:hypothetical protein
MYSGHQNTSSLASTVAMIVRLQASTCKQVESCSTSPWLAAATLRFSRPGSTSSTSMLTWSAGTSSWTGSLKLHSNVGWLGRPEMWKSGKGTRKQHKGQGQGLAATRHTIGALSFFHEHRGHHWHHDNLNLNLFGSLTPRSCPITFKDSQAQAMTQWF